jgi:flagellar FliJ protein
MNMEDASSLGLVIEIATKARDAIARQAATARNLEHEARAQLRELERYHAEYLVRSARQAERDAAAMRNFAAFIGRLEVAIGQQRATLAHHEARANALQAEHTAAAIKVKSLETLAAGRAAAQRRDAERRERRLEDELANRSHRARTLKPAY